MNRQQLSTKLEQPSRFWKLLCNLKIRYLLLMIFGLLSLIAIMALGWNAIQVYHQYSRAQQMAGANDISQQALLLNSHLARERGFGATLLATPGTPPATMLSQFDQLSSESELALHRLITEVTKYPFIHTIDQVEQQLLTMQLRLNHNRQQFKQSLQAEHAPLSYQLWIDELTARIEEVSLISQILSAPEHEEEHAARYGTLTQDTFFNFSENAGRERALIAAVIAQQRPFKDEELKLLDLYRHNSSVIYKQIDNILTFFPDLATIKEAEKRLNSAYYQHYLQVRNTILQSSKAGEPYPLDAGQWYAQATQWVDTILALSQQVNKHIDDDIAITKKNMRYIVTALFITLIVVLSVFLFAFMITYRRILTPLRELESSANLIASGDFSSSTRISARDEFGDVANAFEVMRTYLLHDREQRHLAEAELRKLSMAIEQSVSSIVITDINGITEYVNPQFHKTTGYTIDEVIGKKFNVLDSGATKTSTYRELWQTIIGGDVWQGELLNRKKNGQTYWDLVSISPVRNHNEVITHFIGIQHDITERKEMEQRLNFMAYHDELTQLPNRALLSDRFGQLTHIAQRNQGKIALIIFDLDRFKLVNDSLGHRIGDMLLVKIAQRLKTIARSSDTITRYGGDEFVILVSNFSTIEVLIDIAKRLCDTIREPMCVDGNALHTSASIGISIWPDDGQDIDTLLRQADTAMYYAKELGGDRFQFFTSELNFKTVQRLNLENALREALQKDQFELYYQPQVNLTTGMIVGAEALIRWNHPKMGLISPIQFIPLAEETNLIIPIGDWVMQTACAQAAQWHKDLFPGLSIAVNVSARQLDDADFIDRIKTILQQNALPAESIEIEITESSIMRQPEKMIRVLEQIKSLGIRLAMDDFGTGYSSLSYLRRFPFDKLKIDRSFIKEIIGNPEDAAITHTISEMAHSLHMTVIAEGVETDIQATYLRRSACDEIQGYLISPPLPAEAFQLLLKQGAPYQGS